MRRDMEVMPKRRKTLLYAAIVLFVAVLGNIMWVEILIGHTLAVIKIGMTEDAVIETIGNPDVNTVSEYYENWGGRKTHVGSKRHYGYYFPYLWDYVLRLPLGRSRAIQVVFGADGSVERLEMRRYVSKSWYVQVEGDTEGAGSSLNRVKRNP